GGKMLASAHPTGHIRLWDPGGRPDAGLPPVPARMLAEFSQGQAPLCSLAFTPDGAALVTGTEYGHVHFWGPATRSLLYLIRGRESPVRALAFSPNGKLAVGQPDLVRLWDLSSWEVRTPFGRSVGPVHALAFTPEGKTLFTASSPGMNLNGSPNRP